ncbi:MAG: bifunctional riboflavin kinase/FAD synthetase [Glaciihabitans sp.]|nr:bifunctional riboflavin kinase/FAD synthetase [Glaciihabitans sp.]MDQ1571051.1 riboflavin kinase / adenylyltransferase [Actinomycetota bacterium]
MRLFERLSDVPPGFGPSAVTIGKFDGVHAGHRAVIADLRAVAAERGLVSTIVTFDRNPLAVLAPEKCPDALISNSQKVELLEAAGVDATLMLTFDREFSEQSPTKFVTDVLVNALSARVVFVGSDFRFGAKGAGNVDLLERLGAEHNFEVRRIGEVTIGGTRRASSTWIRELLESGDVVAAADLLERLPSIRSVVVHGEQRGRELGYPTANLSPDLEGLIPADGVYAAFATVDGVSYPAAVSIGNNPTFEGVPQKQVEAHLLDQELDLYGKPIEVAFVDYVRTMQKFDSVDQLVTQMRLDEDRIRTILGLSQRF